MSEDAYYFPHNFNARHDPKCEELDIDLGNRGYGMFWKLVEIFNEQHGSVPVKRLKALDHELREPESDVLALLDNYDLFQRETIDGVEYFTSRSIRKRREHREQVIEAKSRAGKRSAAIRKAKAQAYAQADAQQVPNSDIANAEQVLNGCSAGVQTDVQQAENGCSTIKGKEIKGKEIEMKEDKSSSISKESTKKFVKPTVEEVAEYIRKNNYNVDAEQFVNFYESKGWKVGTTPMKSWTAAVATWQKRNSNSNGKSLNGKSDRAGSSGYVPDYSKTSF